MISGTLSTSFRSLFGNWSTSDSGGKTCVGVGPAKGLHQGRAGKVRPEIVGYMNCLIKAILHEAIMATGPPTSGGMRVLNCLKNKVPAGGS